MDFRQADEQFKQLKARYEAGELTEAEFKTQLQDLMLQDEAGTWWMIGYETERWYRHDGTDWVQADPPDMQSQAMPATPERLAEPAIEEKPVTKAGLNDSRLEREKPVPPPVPVPSRPVERKAPIPTARRPAGTWILIAAGLLVGGFCLLIGVTRLISLFTPGAPATQAPAFTEAPTEIPTEFPTETPTEAPTEAPTAAPTEAPPAPRDKLFQDDFEDLNSGWPAFSNDNTSNGYSGDGRYLLRSSSAGRTILALPGQKLSDVSIEVDVTDTGDLANNGFGVVCRYQDANNFYYLGMNSEGYQGIGIVSGGQGKYLSADIMQFSDAIKTGSATNHLRADCTGSTLTFYVNDQVVSSITDTTLTGGDVGLILWGTTDQKLEIAFDNFVVFQP